MQPHATQPTLDTSLFPLTFEQCELLARFAATPNIAALAVTLGRDISVISRRLQQLAKVAPVLEKRQGRWNLTEQGRRLAQWAQEAARTQRRLLAARPLLRLTSTREFAARVLAPRLRELIFGFPSTRVSIHTTDEGVEGLLLRGGADLGFDCGRPRDPEVKFRSVATEPLAVVASPRWIGRRNRKKLDLPTLPHLAFSRIDAGAILGLDHALYCVVAHFNDIASTRAACVSGFGWALLPAYSVREEVEAGRLIAIHTSVGRPERFGVYWLRGRSDLDPTARSALQWLEGISLSL